MMDSSLLSNDDEMVGTHPAKSHVLQLAYQESMLKSELITKDESARRLRLRILVLEDENDELQEQLVLCDDRIDSTERGLTETQQQLEQSEAKFVSQENEIRTQARELNNLRAELSSMNGISVDSTKLLTEKLTLTRELATLKPELEHLRAQAANQQLIISEKLSLQRQVSALEVDLETAKNASRRIALKESANEKEEGDLREQLETVRKELMREKRERERVQKAAEKENGEWESRKILLETKLETIRSKYRTTRGQLKDTQTELAQAQATTTQAIAKSKNTTSANPRKRQAVQMDADAAIGTPDGVAVRGKRLVTKRGKPDQTLLGEKSAFSITPFLNRTVNIGPETPQGDTETETGHQGSNEVTVNAINEEHSIINEDAQITASPSIAAKSKTKKKAVEKPVLNSVNAGTLNVKAPPKKSRKMNTLEKVTEEEGDENNGPDQTVTAPVVTTKTSKQLQPPAPEELETKKKRRKLGVAKTLFDEEDVEATKRPAKITLGPARLLGRAGGNKNTLLGAQAGGFAAFSPLKKDRRGAQASFLA